MFTGIIEEIGYIKNISAQGSGKRLEFQGQKIIEDLSPGQSIAVNGVCLTVVNIKNHTFIADAIAETLSKTTLAQIKTGEPVNFERAIRFQDRLGGHLVQGHVDDVGIIKQIEKKATEVIFAIEIPITLQKYCISKGSIAIDGVSLTIANKNKNLLTVAVIPHTLTNTTFQYKKVEDNVNIEVDLIAKYVEQFLQNSGETKINSEWLKQQGF